MLPSAPFDPANSIYNGLSIIQLKIGANTLVYEATQLDDNPQQEAKYLARPGLDGVVRNVRRVRSKGAEEWTFDLHEVKRVLEILGGVMTGAVAATCTLWIPDVDDDTATAVALKSQTDFACVVSRDGKITYGNNEFSKATIKIESLEKADITWTKDSAP